MWAFFSPSVLILNNFETLEKWLDSFRTVSSSDQAFSCLLMRNMARLKRWHRASSPTWDLTRSKCSGKLIDLAATTVLNTRMLQKWSVGWFQCPSWLCQHLPKSPPRILFYISFYYFLMHVLGFPYKTTWAWNMLMDMKPHFLQTL